MKNDKKNVTLLACLFTVVVAVFGMTFLMLRPTGTDGEKKFTLKVISADGSSTKHKLSTEEEFLGDALLSEGLLTGYQGEYGLFITSVNGITADSTKQEWWCLTVDNEEWLYGIDQTPVTDGGHYELTLKVGW